MSTALGTVSGTFNVPLPPRPYPGLRPFEPDEWAIFFGRERMIDAIVQRLLSQRLLVVHGDSGCGKSSVIRAGVLPRLMHSCARSGVKWRTAMTAPGNAPLGNLSADLARVSPASDEGLQLDVRRALNRGRAGLDQIARHLALGEQEHCCILIDQFEELFGHARRSGPHEAELIIDFLTGAAQRPELRIYIVLTMRSEFLGACAQFSGFAETVNATQYLLPRMDRQDMVRAIREPALLYDGEVTLALAERLIADAGVAQDQLPLIQHGLMLLHRDHAQGTPRFRLDLDHYEAHKETLASLLSHHANDVMAATEKGHESARVVETLFRALIEINADGQAIRRPRPLKELIEVSGGSPAQVRKAIDDFRVDGVSFLRPYAKAPIAPLDDANQIDISHEALIRCWNRIAEPRDGWLVREFKAGLIWRALLVQAESFEANPKELLTPAATEERAAWLKGRKTAWAARYGGGWERVDKLIQTSAKAHRRAQLKKVAAYVLGAVVLAILGSVMAWMAIETADANARAAAADLRKAKAEADVAEASAALAQRELEIQKGIAAKETDRAEARAQAITADQLDTAYRELVDLASSQTNVVAKQKIDELAASIGKQVTTLGDGAVRTPRIYVHISSEAQKAPAEQLKTVIEALWTGKDKISVIGIEQVKYQGDPELRCFGKNECGEEGQALVRAINEQLATPKLKLRDLSERYPKTPARQYGIWFGPGDVQSKNKSDFKIQRPPSQYNVALNAIGLDAATLGSMNERLKEAGYGLLLEQSTTYDQRPTWFAKRSTVLFYDNSALRAASQLSDLMTELTGIDFQVARGGGFGVNPDKANSTLIVHYLAESKDAGVPP